MTITVASLALAPVKSTRLTGVDTVQIGPTGVVGDRAFVVVNPANELLLSARNPALMRVVARRDGDVLELTFPDGRVVAAVPEPGEPAMTANYEGRPIAGRIVEGELAVALSDFLERPVRLIALDAGERAADDAPVTISSRASLEAVGIPDARRYRMSITLDGVAAWEEHGWGGRELTIGSARLRVTEPVPRCVVTTRDPESGRRDAPTLKRLAELRGKRDVTFGMWCEVLASGQIRVGDEAHVSRDAGD